MFIKFVADANGHIWYLITIQLLFLRFIDIDSNIGEPPSCTGQPFLPPIVLLMFYSMFLQEQQDGLKKEFFLKKITK